MRSGMSFSAHMHFFDIAGGVSPFPPPLRGPRRAKLALEGRKGDTPRGHLARGTLTPNPSPQGGGERSAVL